MNLYEVQDADRPVYVIAESWESALRLWAARMAVENKISIDDIESPKGVRLVAENTSNDFPEVLYPGRTTITRIPAVPRPQVETEAKPILLGIEHFPVRWSPSREEWTNEAWVAYVEVSCDRGETLRAQFSGETKELALGHARADYPNLVVSSEVKP